MTDAEWLREQADMREAICFDGSGENDFEASELRRIASKLEKHEHVAEAARTLINVGYPKGPFTRRLREALGALDSEET